jgi:hypothetical protein
MAAESNKIQIPCGNPGNKINQEVGKHMSFGNTTNAINMAPFLRPQKPVKTYEINEVFPIPQISVTPIFRAELLYDDKR